MFSPELAEKPYIVAYNKMDLPEAYERWPLFKEKLEARGIRAFCMSAVKREGTRQVISTAYEILQKSREERDTEGRILSNIFFTNITVALSCPLSARYREMMSLDVLGWVDPGNLNHVADEINKQRTASINDFRITRRDSSNTWHVVGSGLQRFIQMTNWRYCLSLYLSLRTSLSWLVACFNMGRTSS